MTNLIAMQFEDAAVRVVDVEGEPWFVGKDVAEALGYTNPAKAFGDHCKGVTKRYPLSTAGGMQEVRILSEPDVLRLIIGSNLPAAERFERWVFEEVLPTIRKTGSYTVPSKTPLRLVGPEFKAALSIAKLVGFKGNQVTLAAAKAVNRMYGVDPLKLIDATHLIAEVQVRHYTPTELGQQMGESARAFNKRLEQAGLQLKNTHGDWMPTPKGEPHAVLVDTGKQHSNGTPVQQLRWLESVIDVLTDPRAA